MTSNGWSYVFCYNFGKHVPGMVSSWQYQHILALYMSALDYVICIQTALLWKNLFSLLFSIL